MFPSQQASRLIDSKGLADIAICLSPIKKIPMGIGGVVIPGFQRGTVQYHAVAYLRNPGTKISPQTVHTVSVIRVKRPEAPPKKKAIQRQTPEENVSPKKIQKEIRPRKKTTRFKMPFELNVKLPQGQGNIPTLYMEKYALDGIEVYGAGEIDQPIVAIVRVPPIYPIRARRLGIEGFVTV